MYLCSDAFVGDFVEKKLIGRLQKTVDKLVDFEDTQSATYLLRVSFSIVRAVHFMRTNPLEQWKDQAIKFDKMIRQATVSILGFPMDDVIFAQACLTPRLGGLGLRKVTEHASLAFHASWFESQKTAREEWKPPPQLPGRYLSQKEASFDFDSKIHAYLIAPAPSRSTSRMWLYHSSAIRRGRQRHYPRSTKFQNCSCIPPRSECN